MGHHDYGHRARLRLEPLEDRRTPTAVGLVRDAIAAPPGGASAQAVLSGDGSDLTPFGSRAEGLRVVWGESAVVDGARMATWALVYPRDGTILAAGVTFSVKMAEEMPPADGPGPAHAFASLDFPAEVRDATFLNHLEMQSNPHGHEAGPGNVNPDRNRVPHFDFHFYGIPEEQVWGIPDQGPPLAPVPPERLPAGYTQPARSVLQMGRHSSPIWSLSDPGYLTKIMILGYLPDGSQMHFLEPMVSQQTLLARQDFTLPVPVPQDLGRGAPTLYPTSFNAVFQGNAWTFVLSDFVSVPAGASGIQVAAADVPAVTGSGPAVYLSVEGLGDPPAGAFGLPPAVAQALLVVRKSGDAVDGANVLPAPNIILSPSRPDAPPTHGSPILFQPADGWPLVGEDWAAGNP
jgi:hypothetical protein